jgi:hypothetical protein
MPDGVTDHSNGEKPDGEKRRPHTAFYSHRAKKPQRDPAQVQDHEEFAGPSDESQELWRPDIKVSDEFFREMEALKGNTGQVKAND